MAAPPATTSSARTFVDLVHRQWFIVHPWTRVDRWGTGGDASRRYWYTPVSITQADNECRLEGDKTHEIFHFLSKKVGGGTFPMWSPPGWKVGGTRPPRPPPIYARVKEMDNFKIWVIALCVSLSNTYAYWSPNIKWENTIALLSLGSSSLPDSLYLASLWRLRRLSRRCVRGTGLKQRR